MLIVIKAFGFYGGFVIDTSVMLCEDSTVWQKQLVVINYLLSDQRWYGVWKHMLLWPYNFMGKSPKNSQNRVFWPKKYAIKMIKISCVKKAKFFLFFFPIDI